MFTATADIVLPTTVTGSWPRPRWFDGRLDGRPLSTRMKDIVYREQFTDALAALLDEQERAGLDIMNHGDLFHDEDLAGHQWMQYPMERWKGLQGQYFMVSPDLPSFPPGTILNEIFTGWRWPRVVGKIDRSEENPLEYAKIWRLAQARTSKPIKFGTVCASGLYPVVDVVDYYDKDDNRQLIWDLATVMNQELRELAAAGCKVIQVEEPMLHYVAMYHPERTDIIDMLVDAFNHEVSGLEDVEVWVHTCWGNPNMQRAMEDVSYANSVEIFLDRLDADVWTIEASDTGGAEFPLFAPFRDSMSTKLCIGVVSHRLLQVETPEQIAELTREALKYIDADKLVLSTDCGFGRQGNNRMASYYKAAAIAMGANIVRRELGVEERPVPAADPAMQTDVVTQPRESRLFAAGS